MLDIVFVAVENALDAMLVIKTVISQVALNHKEFTACASRIERCSSSAGKKSRNLYPQLCTVFKMVLTDGILKVSIGVFVVVSISGDISRQELEG